MPTPTRYALSVLCEDKVGLVAKLTHAISALGGNIEVLHQGVLQGYFVFMLLVTFDRGPAADQVRQALESAGSAGQFVVSILPRGAQAVVPPATGSSFILTLTGPDAPGLLERTTAYIADHHINIEGLTGETHDGQCMITARLTIPPSVDIRAARLEGAHQVGGLRGNVQAGRNAHAVQGAFFGKALADQAQDRHFAFGPIDLAAPPFGLF
jgi:predicted amino acid-binding ACT domain protein